MKKWLFLALLVLGVSPGHSWAQTWPGQCPTGTVATAIGCQQEAVSPQSTDLLLGWQIGQSPHTRAFQFQQITAAIGGPFLPLTGGTMSGPIQNINTTSVTGYEQFGSTILQVCCNSGNMFGDGSGTVTLIGLGAGAHLNSADYLTTAIGFKALNSSTQSNSESTAVGWKSQNAITTGGFNTSLGVNTVGTCVTCVHLLAVGTDALRNTTTASYDLAIGVSTLLDDGSSGNNIAIGDSTYKSNAGASGQFNIAIGFNTFQGLSLTTGDKNIAIGAGISNAVTSGSKNIIIGHVAGNAVTSGTSNQLIGQAAGILLTTASGDIIIGDNAGSKITTGAQNVVIGPGVGSATLATGTRNILLGTSTAVDTSGAGTNFTINIDNVFTATGTGVPATSSSSIAGSLKSSGFISGGTKFTITGCAAGTTVGGATAGTFLSGTTGACTVTITLNGATGLTAPNGWACSASDLTTPANLISQSFSGPTTCILTGTTVTGDMIAFQAQAF